MEGVRYEVKGVGGGYKLACFMGEKIVAQITARYFFENSLEIQDINFIGDFGRVGIGRGLVAELGKIAKKNGFNAIISGEIPVGSSFQDLFNTDSGFHKSITLAEGDKVSHIYSRVL